MHQEPKHNDVDDDKMIENVMYTRTEYPVVLSSYWVPVPREISTFDLHL